MNWVVDILVVLFVGILTYRGIKLGFMNTTFTLITAFIWIALGIGIAVGGVLLLDVLGVMHAMSVAFLGFGEGFAGFLQNIVGLSVPGADVALYTCYAIVGFVFLIPGIKFAHWVGRKFEQLVRFVRSKVGVIRVIGSILGGVINFAVSAGIVLAVFWLVGAVNGSGLFDFTHEVLSSGTLSGLIYNNNPLYGMLGEMGSLAQDVAYIISGDFLIG